MDTLLGLALSKKRGDRSLRDIEKECNIPIATFSRLERGSSPDHATFIKAMEWLGVPRSQWWRYMNDEVAAR